MTTITHYHSGPHFPTYWRLQGHKPHSTPGSERHKPHSTPEGDRHLPTVYFTVLHINLKPWETLSLDHPTWQSKLTTGVHAAEIKCTTEVQRKHAVHKAWATATPTCVPWGVLKAKTPKIFRGVLGLSSPRDLSFWDTHVPQVGIKPSGPRLASPVISGSTCQSWSSSTTKDEHYFTVTNLS